MRSCKRMDHGGFGRAAIALLCALGLVGSGQAYGDADATEPSAPGTPVGSDITPTSLTLTWDASTDNVGVEKYHVFRQAYSRDVELATTSDTSVKLTGLVAATTYSFYVTAEDAAGNVSVASAIGKATTAKAVDAGTGSEVGTDAGDRADAGSASGEDAGAAGPVESKGGSPGLGCSLGGSSRGAGLSLAAFAALAIGIGILRRGARERAGSAPY